MPLCNISKNSQTRTRSKTSKTSLHLNIMTPTIRTTQFPHVFFLFKLHRLFSFFLLLWSSHHSAIVLLKMCLLKDILLLPFGIVSPMASCPVLSCLALPCPALPCHVMSRCVPCLVFYFPILSCISYLMYCKGSPFCKPERVSFGAPYSHVSLLYLVCILLIYIFAE